MKLSMEKIVNLAKVRGFVYSGSEIYGGLANTWDYGNLGCRTEEQCQESMVAEIHSGESVQCRCGLLRF